MVVVVQLDLGGIAHNKLEGGGAAQGFRSTRPDQTGKTLASTIHHLDPGILIDCRKRNADPVGAGFAGWAWDDGASTGSVAWGATGWGWTGADGRPAGCSGTGGSTGVAGVSVSAGTAGSIAAGRLADLVILSHDPAAVTPEGIRDIEVDMTIIDGVVDLD